MQLLNANLYRLAHELELRIRKRMNGRSMGESYLHGKGRGMEFRDVRPYVGGDDIRLIDWNVSSRTGEIHVKEFFLERDIPVIIFLDLSYSMLSNQKKMDAGFQLAIFLAYVHFLGQNKTRIICYSDKIDPGFEPIRSKEQLWRSAKKLQDKMNFAKTSRLNTNHNLPYQFLQENMQLRSLVYWISDFSVLNKNTWRSIHKKHEIHGCALDSGMEEFNHAKWKSFFFQEPAESKQLATQYKNTYSSDMENLRFNFQKNLTFFKINQDLAKQILISFGNSL